MKLHLVAVGRKMPAWVTTAFDEYNKRLPPELTLRLTEVAPARRNKSANPDVSRQEERRNIKAALPDNAVIIALDEHGSPLASYQLAETINHWQQDGRDVALIIGGADGLAKEILGTANMTWSLSALTLPHALVRIVLAEQVYRAWTILNQHPYHRE